MAGRKPELKGTRLMAVADGNGLPIAIYARSAAPAEVTLVHETLRKSFLAEESSGAINVAARLTAPLFSSGAQQQADSINK